MRVEVISAWPRRFESARVELPEGATVADAVRAAAANMEGISGYAIHGIACDADTPIHEGDRVELLRPLQADPKEARRRRARPPAR